MLEDAENGLTGDFRQLLQGLQEDLHALDKRVAVMDKRIQSLANSHPASKRLLKIPGIGPITARTIDQQMQALGIGGTKYKTVNAVGDEKA